jgi:hypothetical protein
VLFLLLYSCGTGEGGVGRGWGQRAWWVERVESKAIVNHEEDMHAVNAIWW